MILKGSMLHKHPSLKTQSKKNPKAKPKQTLIYPIKTREKGEKRQRAEEKDIYKKTNREGHGGQPESR